MSIPDLTLVAMPPAMNIGWSSAEALWALEQSEVIVAPLPVERFYGPDSGWWQKITWSDSPAGVIAKGLEEQQRVVYLYPEGGGPASVWQMLDQHPQWLKWIKRTARVWPITLAADWWTDPKELGGRWQLLAEDDQKRPSMSVSVASSEQHRPWLPASLAQSIVVETMRVKSLSRPSWWSTRPLYGIRLLVLREGEGAVGAIRDLSHWGAEVALEPILTIEPAPLNEQWWRSLAPYQWTIFTSANAVHFTMRVLRTRRLELARFGGKVAAVGSATARALAEYGVFAALQAKDSFDQEGLLQAFESEPLAGARVLWFTGDRSRPRLSDGLKARGADVDMVPVYQNCQRPLSQWAVSQIHAGSVHGLLYSSSSLVSELLNQLDDGTIEVLRQIPGFSIGRQTSLALRKAGLLVSGEAPRASWHELAQTVARYFEHDHDKR